MEWFLLSVNSFDRKCNVNIQKDYITRLNGLKNKWICKLQRDMNGVEECNMGS